MTTLNPSFPCLMIGIYGDKPAMARPCEPIHGQPCYKVTANDDSVSINVYAVKALHRFENAIGAPEFYYS